MGIFDVLASLAGGAAEGYNASQDVALEQKKQQQQAIKDRLANAQAEMLQRTEAENLQKLVAGNAAQAASKTMVPAGPAEVPLAPGLAGPVLPPSKASYKLAPGSLEGLPASRRAAAEAQALGIRQASDDAVSDKQDLNQSLIDQRTQSGQIALLREQLAASKNPLEMQFLMARIDKLMRPPGPQKPVAWADVELDPNKPGVKTHVGLDADGKIVAYPHLGDTPRGAAGDAGTPGALHKGMNATAQNRLAQASKVYEQAKAVSAALDNAKLKGQVGGLGGLLTAAKSKLGFDTPEFSGFEADEGSLEAALPFLHQFRGGKQVVEHFKSVIGGPMTSIANKKAAYRALMDFTQRAARGDIGVLPEGLMDDGSAPAAPAGGGPATVSGPGDISALPSGTPWISADGSRHGTAP